MNLHEYQAKELFANFNIPVPKNKVVSSIGEVDNAIKSLSSDKLVVKAQVHAGGRGKAGGVAVLDSAEEIKTKVSEMLGSRLVTFQTDEKGQPINSVLIEETCDIGSELYLGAVIDRATQRVVVMASTEGGMDIEEVAEKTPEKILKIVVNPLVKIMPFQVRELAFGLGLDKNQTNQLFNIVTNMIDMFVAKDFALVEINPLVITKQGDLICLDGKVNIDNNSLYRQKELSNIRDLSQEDEREIEASEHELNYVSLEGSVGCMVNGAGLAMATMDLIKLEGGNPANFLDVGGGATAERVAKALEIILSDKNVKSILVNIFGGIVRCDLIADGIIEAVEKTKIDIPLVVRLEGNNSALGLEKLEKCEFNIVVADSLTKAAQLAIQEAKN